MYPLMPTADDVEDKLRSISFWPEGDDSEPQVIRAKAQTEIGALAAVDEWENLTGWTPFLSPEGALDQTWHFHPDAASLARNGVLKFGGGLLSLTSLSFNGRDYSLNDEFFSRAVLKPDNARAKRKPYFYLAFPFGRWRHLPWMRSGYPISITGRWGFCASEIEGVPADVWSTVLDRAVLITLLGVENPRDISNLSQDGFSIAFDPVGPIDPKTVLNSLGKEFAKVAERYNRTRYGG